MNLRRLLDQTTVALMRAREDAECQQDAVNWGDLSCVRAEMFVTHDGEVGFRVWIEEAAPHATHLQVFVAAELVAAGFDNVDVRTEW